MKKKKIFMENDLVSFYKYKVLNAAQYSTLYNDELLLCVSDGLHNSLTRDVFNLQ